MSVPVSVHVYTCLRLSHSLVFPFCASPPSHRAERWIEIVSSCDDSMKRRIFKFFYLMLFSRSSLVAHYSSGSNNFANLRYKISGYDLISKSPAEVRGGGQPACERLMS